MNDSEKNDEPMTNRQMRREARKKRLKHVKGTGGSSRGTDSTKRHITWKDAQAIQEDKLGWTHGMGILPLIGIYAGLTLIFVLIVLGVVWLMTPGDNVKTKIIMVICKDGHKTVRRYAIGIYCDKGSCRKRVGLAAQCVTCKHEWPVFALDATKLPKHPPPCPECQATDCVFLEVHGDESESDE